MRTGWQNVGDTGAFLMPGAMATGLDESGRCVVPHDAVVMLTVGTLLRGSWYYSACEMVTGWLNLGGTVLPERIWRAMVTGTQWDWLRAPLASTTGRWRGCTPILRVVAAGGRI